MLFFYSTAASLLALCSLSDAFAYKHKRATSDVTLFAYGSEANGATVFYDNGELPTTSHKSILKSIIGLAYIGSEAPSWGTSTNITFLINVDDTTVPWTIESNSTTSTFNQTLELYIIPTSGSYEQVGFVSTNGTAPTGAVTTGFAWFGTQVVSQVLGVLLSYSMLFHE